MLYIIQLLATFNDVYVPRDVICFVCPYLCFVLSSKWDYCHLRYVSDFCSILILQFFYGRFFMCLKSTYLFYFVLIMIFFRSCFYTDVAVSPQVFGCGPCPSHLGYTDCHVCAKDYCNRYVPSLFFILLFYTSIV